MTVETVLFWGGLLALVALLAGPVAAAIVALALGLLMAVLSA